MTKYDYNEEFTYSYSMSLQPVQLLYTYGMQFENNPYAIINIPQINFFNTLNLK